MAKLERSITINAPVEKVFDYVSDPNNMLEIWPSLVEVKNVQPLPNGSYCYDWTYKMAGIRIKTMHSGPRSSRNSASSIRTRVASPAPSSGPTSRRTAARE